MQIYIYKFQNIWVTGILMIIDKIDNIRNIWDKLKTVLNF